MYAVHGRAWSAIDEKLGGERRKTVRVGRTKRRVLCMLGKKGVGVQGESVRAGLPNHGDVLKLNTFQN